MAFSRLEHQGGAILTTLASDIGSGDTSLSLSASTNWPTGTNPFYLVIDPGLSNEEKILATARSTNSLTGLTRGVDGTSAAAHTAGAAIRHIFTAVEADEANNAARQTVGVITTKGDLTAGSASQTVSRLGVGANDTVLIADSAQTTGIKWGTITGTSFGAGVAGNGLSLSAGALAVNTDGVTLGIAADAVKVLNAGIDTLQIAPGAVTTTKIGAGAVDTTQLATGAVTVTKIPDGTITAAKLHTNIFGTGIASATPSGGTATMTVTHGCTFTPTVVVATVQSPVGGGTALVASVDNIGATTFTAHIFNVAAGAYYTTQAVILMYICLP